MKSIEIEYNQDLRPLEDLLSGVKRNGDFYAHGVMELPMPRVDVEGVGPLSLPVPKEQIAAIVQQAVRAPYGKGETTIVDTSVRKVWQIAPGKIRVGGKSWNKTFDAILSQAMAGLGCEGASVSTTLYKLLVYDKDGFFLPHRDTEKAKGMFGTLVITLPSVHQGGELRIRHLGREVTVDASAADFSEISWVAFYADCEHEALPVREGNRVCLVYNLIQKPAKDKIEVLRAPENEPSIAEAAEILRHFLGAGDGPLKIAWLLDHQYSPEGLSFSLLKAADAARAAILLGAAKRAQCAAYLGIVHIGDSGAAEPDYDQHAYSRQRRYERRGSAEEDREYSENFQVITTDRSWKYVDDWRDAGDSAVDFGSIPLAGGELLPEGALDEEKPDTQRLMEASGNEGATYERSYHRAAIVIWLETRYPEVLLQAGVVAAMPYLKRLSNAGPDVRSKALELAARMVNVWEAGTRVYEGRFYQRTKSAQRVQMLQLLVKLDDGESIGRFIGASVAPGYDGSENAALVSAASAIGLAKAAAPLSALILARMPGRSRECTELLLALDGNEASFLEVAAAAVSALDRIEGSPAWEPNLWAPEAQRQKREPGPEVLVNLFRMLGRLETPDLGKAAAEKVAARPEVFDPVTAVVPALDRLKEEDSSQAAAPGDSFLSLWVHAAEFLLRRSETPPTPPSDWSQQVKLSCSCADCRELQSFARDPIAQVHRFRAKQDRRRHLEDVIGRDNLEMSRATDTTTSPQILVCTKNRRNFNRRLEEYWQEIGAMGVLVRLAGDSNTTAALSRRLLAAAACAPRSGGA